MLNQQRTLGIVFDEPPERLQVLAIERRSSERRNAIEELPRCRRVDFSQQALCDIDFSCRRSRQTVAERGLIALFAAGDEVFGDETRDKRMVNPPLRALQHECTDRRPLIKRFEVTQHEVHRPRPAVPKSGDDRGQRLGLVRSRNQRCTRSGRDRPVRTADIIGDELQ